MTIVPERKSNRYALADIHAIHILQATHPEAKVTHEASIGTVDKQEIETIMAHELYSEQAQN